MRGTRGAWCRSRGGEGSIPAGAGNPRRHSARTASRWVYPRGCGEPDFDLEVIESHRGLSPRVRGTPRLCLSVMDPPGSIPAGAGNPFSIRPTSSINRVYPRGCGEPSRRSNEPTPRRGLSPRVRGTRPCCVAGLELSGSIPAGAGNPPDARTSRRPGGVYPRGCGEPVPVALRV